MVEKKNDDNDMVWNEMKWKLSLGKVRAPCNLCMAWIKYHERKYILNWAVYFPFYFPVDFLSFLTVVFLLWWVFRVREESSVRVRTTRVISVYTTWIFRWIYSSWLFREKYFSNQGYFIVIKCESFLVVVSIYIYYNIRKKIANVYTSKVADCIVLCRIQKHFKVSQRQRQKPLFRIHEINWPGTVQYIDTFRKRNKFVNAKGNF